jgi:succinylglutamate desuccinylase
MPDSVLQGHIASFETCRPRGGFDYRYSASYGSGRGSLHLVVGSMIHGNEVGSLPAVVRLMDELSRGVRTFEGRITFFIGNPEAGLQDARFLESDLNRVFTDDPPDTHEGRRAREIKPILDAADVFLDLHQTILATVQPFYIAPFQMDGWHWARGLAGARSWVTRHPGQAFSSGTCCADEYVRLRGKPGITLELGAKGFGHGAERRAYDTICRAMEIGDAVLAGQAVADIAARRPDLDFYETTYRERFASEALALRSGLINFQPVSAGEDLSGEDSPKLLAPHEGMVLFPKYPPRIDGCYKLPLPGEIYRIVSKLSEHPTVRYADAFAT